MTNSFTVFKNVNPRILPVKNSNLHAGVLGLLLPPFYFLMENAPSTQLISGANSILLISYLINGEKSPYNLLSISSITGSYFTSSLYSASLPQHAPPF